MIQAQSFRDRFLSRVSPEPNSGCWLWAGSVSAGYGVVYFGGKIERGERAHRTAYRLFRGEIPIGLHIDHLCRNTFCVNPDHLEAVTNSENTRRAAAANRRTHCRNGHEFTLENTWLEKANNNARHCRTCHRARARKRYQQQSESGSVPKRLCVKCGARWRQHNDNHCRSCHRAVEQEYGALVTELTEV